MKKQSKIDIGDRVEVIPARTLGTRFGVVDKLGAKYIHVLLGDGCTGLRRTPGTSRNSFMFKPAELRLLVGCKCENLAKLGHEDCEIWRTKTSYGFAITAPPPKR